MSFIHPPKLTLITEDHSFKDIKQLQLGKSYTIGRQDDADIQLKNDYVSKRHAQINSDKGYFWIKDLASTNGTFLNSKRISNHPEKLKNEDRIQFGRNHSTVLMFVEGTLDDTFVDTFKSKDDQYSSEVSNKVIILNSESMDVYIRGSLLSSSLTKKEFSIFELLYGKEGKVCTKDEIAAKGWPERSEGNVADEEIHQQMKSIRQKLSVDLKENISKEYIVTYQGTGYRFNNKELKIK